MLPDSHRQENESLDPEFRRGIEQQFDKAADQTERFAAAFVYYLKRALLLVVILLVIAFGIDYIGLRMNQNAIGSVTIRRYYAVGLKNNRTEFDNADSVQQACVNSIFPHMGYSPCWYLRRHNVQEIDI